MSLADAWALRGETPPLPEGPPYPCTGLNEWAGVAFEMPPGDPRIGAIHRGDPSESPPLDNLQGAARYWEDHPDWMAFLEPESPLHRDKLIERALYLRQWSPHLPPGCRVLDVGGGIGRFTQWLLERGCTVELVDPDLRSLWRAVNSAVNLPGSLDVHWTTGECLPDLAPVDVVIACEVLCYVEDPARVLRNLLRVLRPGGMLLLSVEARWGWAMAADAQPGTISGFFSGIVHVPGDVWVRTYTEDDVRALLAPLTLVELQPSHYALSGPFELASGPLPLHAALALEDRLRAHPVSRPLNRAWMACAQKLG